MKRVALFILALIAIVIADEDAALEAIAKKYDSNKPEIQACLKEAGLTLAEMINLIEKWGEIEDDNIDDEIKQYFTKYNVFLACLLEKNEMMVDSKFVVDKLLQSLEKDDDWEKAPNIESLRKCINSLNEDSQMTREDRTFGLMLCVISEMNGDKK